MEAAKPANTPSETSIKDEMTNDLKKEFKKIVDNHLDERTYKDDKIKIWVNNIITEAKEYFINKYPSYDLFLFCLVSEKGVYYRQNSTYAAVIKSDEDNFADLEKDYLYVTLRFFFFKHYNLTYSLDDIESDIIKKGNELLVKYLEERKYDYDKVDEYNKLINKEHINFILEKEKGLRCYILTRIFRNPIKRYFFKYLVHGKDIYSKMFQNYTNDSLTCCHDVFFFK